MRRRERGGARSWPRASGPSSIAGTGARSCAWRVTVSLIGVLPRLRPAQHVVNGLVLEAHLHVHLRRRGSEGWAGVASVRIGQTRLAHRLFQPVHVRTRLAEEAQLTAISLQNNNGARRMGAMGCTWAVPGRRTSRCSMLPHGGQKWTLIAGRPRCGPRRGPRARCRAGPRLGSSGRRGARRGSTRSSSQVGTGSDPQGSRYKRHPFIPHPRVKFTFALRVRGYDFCAVSCLTM